MVEELERAQKALRDMDYDSVSEDGDEEPKRSSIGRSSGSSVGGRKKRGGLGFHSSATTNTSTNTSTSTAPHEHRNSNSNASASHPAAHLPSPEVSSASAFSLERFLSSTDEEIKNQDTDGDGDGYGETMTTNTNTNNNGTKNNPGDKDDNILIDPFYTTSTRTAQKTHTSTMPSAIAYTSHTPSGSISVLSPTLPKQSPLASKLLTKIPAPNSLFDDDDSTAAFTVELQTFNTAKSGSEGDITNMNITVDSNRNRNGSGANANTNTNTNLENDRTRASTNHHPGTAGYLEMEKEPPREVYDEYSNDNGNSRRNIGTYHVANTNTAIVGESIKTDSGLVLTHRKIVATATVAHRNQQQQHNHNHQQHQHQQQQHGYLPPHQNVFRDTQQDYFEAHNGIFHGRNRNNTNSCERREGGNYFAGGSGSFVSGGFGGGGNGNGKNSMVMVQAKRLMSYVKIWVLLFSLVALSMTGAFFHSLGRQDDPKTLVTKTDTTLSSSPINNISMETNANANVLLPNPIPEKILLLPLSDISQPFLSSIQQQQQYNQHPRRLQMLRERDQLKVADSGASSHRFIPHLRQEFEDWMKHHAKTYHSNEEKEKRFSIWSLNHQRTAEKNTRHGPCTLTKQHVFGSNHFKDLAPEEFQAKFLTGYKGAFADVLEEKQQALSPNERKLRKDSGVGMVLNPEIHKIEYHESVVQKQRHLKQNGSSSYHPQVMGASSMYCKWYDLSCILRYVWLSTGIQFGIIGTMEPRYDADAFPNSVDWRDSGAVTDVRTQGECGACWAVTGVETVESAYFLATGTLYTLSESEIIVCDDTCEMCSGGWPQNAFEWVMDHGGLPLQSSLPYDAYTLIALTSGLEGDSDYYNEQTVESYRDLVCPTSDGGGDSHSGSNDQDQDSYWEDGMENENYADYSNQGRYGNIRGYGYATDRCLCYTDGSGCECEDQDEDTAVRNIATYGPAVVCLEASTWQDYSGGIMTSEIGCGQQFLDMNHCVQVVGYAFTDGSDCDDADCSGSNDSDSDNDNSGSGSNSNSGSGDTGDREGYWIVRNQWGSSWGMNGYAYVAMGANTCGILNDITVAYA